SNSVPRDQRDAMSQARERSHGAGAGRKRGCVERLWLARAFATDAGLMSHLLRIGLVSTLAFGFAACGYSEEEWQAQLDKYNRLVAQDQQAQHKLEEMAK